MRKIKRTFAFTIPLSLGFQLMAGASPMMGGENLLKDEGEERAFRPFNKPSDLDNNNESQNTKKSPQQKDRHQGRKQPPLSFSDLLRVPQILHGNALQDGLARLKTKILKAAQAEEDVYAQARDLLELHQSSFTRIPSFVEDYVNSILPPEKVLSFRKKDLLTHETLQPEDTKFNAIKILLG